jgi:UDP-N-acetylmuramyl pentapeptide phosphotransferase/UDP-N-acetylglucosamine-1-phosphate transferase
MTNLAQIAALASVAAGVSALLIVMLRPVLSRYAVARPNARSLHATPTPQGGGIAVIASTIVAVVFATMFAPELIYDHRQLAIVFAATVGLAIVGVTDDVRPMEALPRLGLQAAAVVLIIAALPAELRILPALPWWIERACILLGGVWFVNLVNFMDGIDWMTVAEVVPITAALGLFGLLGALPGDATLVALALCGATIGFAPFNRPVARLFLGDVGSLPIGLLLCWLLIVFAGNGYLAAALLLPLYYLLDTGVTLVRRLITGEPITQAHRSHFYQRTIAHGATVYGVVARVLIVNVGLVALALMTLLDPSPSVQLGALALGVALVVGLLRLFAREKLAR